MSYRCGIGPGLGLEPGPPRVSCDADGCRARIIIDGRPPAWFFNYKAKPGWRLIRRDLDDGGIYRRDYCPEHHEAYLIERGTGREPGTGTL